MIYNERDILFGECGPSLSKVEKQEKWIEIFIKLNSMGANIPDYKVIDSRIKGNLNYLAWC